MAKVLDFSFSINPSNEYSGLISFRIDWFDLLAIQGTLKSLLQHHSPKVSIIQHSSFFMVQLSHPYMTTGKNIVLVRKVISLLFNMLSRFVIDLLPRSKCLLIAWLQSPSAVILKPKKIVCNHFHLFPFSLPFGTFSLRQCYIGFHMDRSDALWAHEYRYWLQSFSW